MKQRKGFMWLLAVGAAILLLETVALGGNFTVSKRNDTTGNGTDWNTGIDPMLEGWGVTIEKETAPDEWSELYNCITSGDCGTVGTGNFRAREWIDDANRNWVPTEAHFQGGQPGEINCPAPPVDLGGGGRWFFGPESNVTDPSPDRNVVFFNWESECDATADNTTICLGETIALNGTFTEGTLANCTLADAVAWGSTDGGTFDPTNQAETVFDSTGVTDFDGFDLQFNVTYGNGWSQCMAEVPVQVNPLPECTINGPAGPVPDGIPQQMLGGPDGVECEWTPAPSGDVSELGPPPLDNCLLDWTPAYATGIATFNLATHDNVTNCANACSANVTVAPPLESDIPEIEEENPSTGEVCLAMNITGGEPGYNLTFDPPTFEDAGGGLWCGQVPPCQETNVTIEINDSIGSIPVLRDILVQLQCTVPTLNEWGLIIFMLVMGVTGGWFIIRRKNAA